MVRHTGKQVPSWAEAEAWECAFVTPLIMYKLHTVALLFCLSCTQQPASFVSGLPLNPSTQDTLPIPNFPQLDRTYTASRKSVESQRKALKIAFDKGQISIDSVGGTFTNCLLSEIIPYWFGTPWAFSGHTEIPRQGEIACGYFVSTTLFHSGLQLNRFRLAQQSPIDEALMLSLGDTVILTKRDDATKALNLWRTTLRDGLYFIGLGQGHVGFLLKRGAGLYLIHSNYSFPAEVQIQRAEESVLMGFQEFYLSNLTFNHQLMEYWMNRETIPLQNKGVQVNR